MKSISNLNIKEINIDLFHFNFNDKKTNYDIMISSVELYLEKLLKFNNKTINDIYIDNEIKIKNNKFSGIYFKSSSNQEIDSLYIYQKFTQRLLKNTFFLYCTPDISSE